MNIKEWFSSNSRDLNYDTIVDSYLPKVPKVTTDQPLYPHEAIDLYELRKKYKDLSKRKFVP